MLRVDLRELAQGRAVPTQGELKQDDPALEGVDITLRDPVAVTGRLQSIGEARFYWQGTARTVALGECRRCLTAVATPLQLEIGALFTQDQIGRASCRERVEISVGAVSLKKKKIEER